MGALKHTARTTADGKYVQGKYARKGKTLGFDNDAVFDAACKSGRLVDEIVDGVRDERESYGHGRARQAQATVPLAPVVGPDFTGLSLAQLKDGYHAALRLADAERERGNSGAAEAHMANARAWRRRINSCKRKGRG
jgi:hypothetical protein